MTRISKLAAVVAMATIPVAGSVKAQSKGTLAPDQIPGVTVYVPYPVAITLDGNLDDWKGVPVQRVEKGTVKGPDPKQNQYFEFAVAADEKNIYLFMRSEDANIISGKHGTNFWNEDSMELYLNFTDNLAAKSYGPGIMQITISPTNIGKKPDELTLSGMNTASAKVRAAVFKTADGWAFEAAVPFPAAYTPEHGKALGFQAHANGASASDRNSKLIWSKADASDQSYQNPSVFGKAVLFKTGSASVP